MTASMVGEVLGSYRVIGELASGGMGTVYRAQHAVLGKPAAIKLLRPELSSNDELVERFFNEAKAASAIDHPGIIEVYDVGHTDDGRAYFVMEMLEGETLGARIKREGRLAEDVAIRIARAIAGALRAAHDKNIIHRDLKPDNVFLVPQADGADERVKVLDFGVAKLSDLASGRHYTQTGVLMGTPLYMAPEQARAAGTIDHRADLYSLGCMLYEMLTGQPPFTGVGAGEIIAMQMFEEPAPPRTRVPAVSAATETIVLRLLEKEPAKRYASAAELHGILSGDAPARESRPRRIVPTPPPTQTDALRLGIDPPLDTVPPPARNSSLGIVAGLGVVVLAAVIALLVARSGDDETPRSAPPATAAPPPTTVGPQPPTAPAPTMTVPAPAPVVPGDDIVVVESGKAPKTHSPAPTVRKPPPPAAVPRDAKHTIKRSPIENEL